MPKSVVVIGGGVAGLSAAIYSRLAGNDVLLVEQHAKVGGKASAIDLQGFRLDPGPSIIILTRIYEQLFRDAGRQMGDYLKFSRLDPISRVFLAGNLPIDLPSDRGECERLVDSISKKDGAQFRALMRSLERISPHIDRSIFARPFEKGWQLVNLDLVSVARDFDVRKTYKELVDERFESPLLRAFFYGFPSYGGQSYHSKAPGAFLIPYLMIQEGVFYPEGGVGAIPNALCKLAIELGVELKLSSAVNSLRSKRNRVTSVILANDTEIEAEAFISGVDRLTTRKWLGHSSDVRASYSYFTLHLGIRKVFPQLKHHTLVIPKDFEKGFESIYDRRLFPDPPIVYVNETSQQDPKGTPVGCSNFFAVVTCPSIESHFDWNDVAPKCRESIFCVLRDAGVSFTDDEVIFERMQSPPYFQEAHGSYKGSLYGTDEAQRLFGMFPARNYDQDYDNLFYCGGSVQPGAGLPMVLLSGKFAASKISK